MTDTLTREQIEAIKAKLIGKQEATEEHGNGSYLQHLKDRIALCDLALIGLAVQPRPIEDAPKNVWGIGSVQGVNGGEQMCMLSYEGLPAKLASTGQRGYYPTHFIPLSALPKVAP